MRFRLIHVVLLLIKLSYGVKFDVLAFCQKFRSGSVFKIGLDVFQIPFHITKLFSNRFADCFTTLFTLLFDGQIVFSGTIAIGSGFGNTCDVGRMQNVNHGSSFSRASFRRRRSVGKRISPGAQVASRISLPFFGISSKLI